MIGFQSLLSSIATVTAVAKNELETDPVPLPLVRAHTFTRYKLTRSKEAPSLLTLPKNISSSASSEQANERVPLWCTVSCCAASASAFSSSSSSFSSSSSRRQCLRCWCASVFLFSFCFACPFLRHRFYVRDPLSACFCSKSKSKRSAESGFRITESVDALLALRRLNRRISRRRCSLNRDALEIRRFLSEDRPEVSVAKAVCVTKPKRQQEC